MTKTRSTKSALISSVLALFLCFTMLLGTTFAWFTDSVTSANNIIQSGKLDIALYHTDNIANKEKVDGNTVLFDGVDSEKWEPGAMAWEKFEVANEGNLALKYQLTLNALNATVVDGVSFATMLKVAVINEANFEYTRANVEAIAADQWSDLATFTLSGNLEKEESTTHGIVIWWQPSANDNLFNMNNENKGKTVSVEVGVTLLATQYTSESDSFDDQYDAGSPWLSAADIDWYVNNPDASEFEINTPEQLAGLAAIVNGTATANVSTYSSTSEATTIKDDFAGQTIKLTGNVDLNNVAWTPIGNFTYDSASGGNGYVYGDSFRGTFDGQGHTISNLYVNAPGTSGVGLFGYVVNATIKNLNIKNVEIDAFSHAAAFVARSTGTSTITNCNLTGDIDINVDWAYVAGIVGKAYAVNLDNCTVTPDGIGKITAENRNAVGGILAWMETDSTVSNCKVQDLELTGWANIGGITGFVNTKSTVANCSAKNLTLTKTRVDGIGTIGLAAGGWSGNNITIKDNTFDTITLNGNMVPNESVNILFGGEYYASETATRPTASNNTQTSITDNRVEVTVFSDANELKEALANGGNFVLANDLSLGQCTMGKDVVIDLNGNTLETTATITLSHNANLTMKGGNYEINNTANGNINAGNNSVLIFEDVNFSYNRLSRTNGTSTNRLGNVVDVNLTDADAKTVVKFKDCVFNNAQVSFHGNTTGEVEATFENCNFTALTNSAPIYVNYNVKGTIEVTDCTFNIQATASDANAIWVNSTTSTAVTVVATNNTFNATKATPTDSSVTGVNQIKVSGSITNISFIGNKGTTSSVTETGTTKTGIAR